LRNAAPISRLSSLVATASIIGLTGASHVSACISFSAASKRPEATGSTKSHRMVSIFTFLGGDSGLTRRAGSPPGALPGAAAPAHQRLSIRIAGLLYIGARDGYFDFFTRATSSVLISERGAWIFVWPCGGSLSCVCVCDLCVWFTSRNIHPRLTQHTAAEQRNPPSLST